MITIRNPQKLETEWEWKTLYIGKVLGESEDNYGWEILKGGKEWIGITLYRETLRLKIQCYEFGIRETHQLGRDELEWNRFSSLIRILIKRMEFDSDIQSGYITN